MNQHRITPHALLAPLIVALAACGGSGADADEAARASTSEATPAESAVDADVAQAASTTVGTTAVPANTAPPVEQPSATTVPPVFPIEVEHALGTTVVEAEPLRVVALDMALVDPVLSLGLPLVGYTTYNDPDGPLPDYFGEAIDLYAADATWVGELLSPNLEAIAQVQPDLIVTAAVRHEAIYDELSAIAPTIATASAGGGWKDNLLLVGEATDRGDRAAELLAQYENRATSVGAAINAAHNHPSISVVRFLDVIRLYQPTSFSGVVLSDAGLARPESQQDPEEFIRVISEEELELADADYLLYTVADPQVAETVEQIQSRPLWNTLTAVQNDTAIAVADERWMSSVGLFGAHLILDDLADIFGVDS